MRQNYCKVFVCLFFNEDLVWAFHPLRWYYDLQVCIGMTHTSVPRECRSLITATCRTECKVDQVTLRAVPDVVRCLAFHPPAH